MNQRSIMHLSIALSFFPSEILSHSLSVAKNIDVCIFCLGCQLGLLHLQQRRGSETGSHGSISTGKSLPPGSWLFYSLPTSTTSLIVFKMAPHFLLILELRVKIVTDHTKSVFSKYKLIKIAVVIPCHLEWLLKFIWLPILNIFIFSSLFVPKKMPFAMD